MCCATPTTRSTRRGSGRSRPGICRGWRRGPRRRCSVSTKRRNRSGLGLQHAAERMSFEQIAELQVFAEHIKALVAAEPFEFGGMHAALHAGGQCAAFQAVAAEIAQPE